MTTGNEQDPTYPLGSSEEERRRLGEGQDFLGGPTRRLFAEADVGEGMRVLDVGSGVGDVSLLAASLVGPGGEVVGVDKDPLAVANARDRVKAAGLRNVEFVEGDVWEADPGGTFDAAVGRFILLYQADPAGLLRRLSDLVRPGGVLAFQDFVLADAGLSYPHSPLWQSMAEITAETFRRVGVQMEMGYGLYGAFVDAGLPAPDTVGERLMGGGPDYPGYQYMAESTRSLLPMAEQLGVTSAREIGIETLAERLRDEVVGLGGVVMLPTIVGAWTTKPESAPQTRT